MNVKSVATLVLLLFVGASVAYLVLQKSNTSSTDTVDAVQVSGDDAAGPSAEYVAYYFHGNRRCPTCQKLESYSNQAVTTGFAGQIDEQVLDWQIVNYDEAGNEHYMDDYELSHQSVVLTRVQDGQVTDWTNLARIWELVGDEAEFTEYVQTEITTFMETH